MHTEAVCYNLKIEDDEESYQEEVFLLNVVREGNVEEAVKRNKEMDEDIASFLTMRCHTGGTY